MCNSVTLRVQASHRFFSPSSLCMPSVIPLSSPSLLPRDSPALYTKDKVNRVFDHSKLQFCLDSLPSLTFSLD